MSTLYAALKGENHLKHGGRMQLGLFLKGIGLSLADALAFWKASFARRTPPEKFDKEYAYNIRHNYGKEGKRTTYTPYGCIKIIQSAPGPGDHHGCPFRQFDEAHLKVGGCDASSSNSNAAGTQTRRNPRRASGSVAHVCLLVCVFVFEMSVQVKMRGKGFTAPQVDEVVALVKGSHYQIACQRYYQYSHGGVMADEVGNHPNAYFDASEQYFRDQQAGGPAAPGAPGAAGATAAGGNAANNNNSNNNNSGVYNAMPTGTAAVAVAPSSTPMSTPPASAPSAAAAPTAAAAAAAAPAAAAGPTPMDIVRSSSPAPSSS